MEEVRWRVRPLPRDGGGTASTAPVRLGFGARGRGLFLADDFARSLASPVSHALAFGEGEAAAWLEACRAGSEGDGAGGRHAAGGGASAGAGDVPLVEVALSELLYIGEHHPGGTLWPPACGECPALVQVLEDAGESWDVKLAAMLLWASTGRQASEAGDSGRADASPWPPLAVWPTYATDFLPDHRSGTHVLLCIESERQCLPSFALRALALESRKDAEAAFRRLFQDDGGGALAAAVAPAARGVDAWMGALAAVRTRSFAAMMPGRGSRGGHPEHVTLMAPVVDLVNHGCIGEAPLAEFGFDGGGASCFEELDPRRACFRLSVPRQCVQEALDSQNAGKGIEVLLAYTSEVQTGSNDRLMENYGFCLPLNPHDRMEGLPAEHAISLCGVCEVWDVVGVPDRRGRGSSSTLHRAYSQGRPTVDDRTLRALRSIPLEVPLEASTEDEGSKHRAEDFYDVEARRAASLLSVVRQSVQSRFDTRKGLGGGSPSGMSSATSKPASQATSPAGDEAPHRVANARAHMREAATLALDVERVLSLYRASMLGRVPITAVGMLIQPLEASSALARFATASLSQMLGLRGSHVVVVLVVGDATAHVAFDFLPILPESSFTAARLFLRAPVPGVVRERPLSGLPSPAGPSRSRVRFVTSPPQGRDATSAFYAALNPCPTLNDARAFAAAWDTELRLPENSCVTFADALVRSLTGVDRASDLLF